MFCFRNTSLLEPIVSLYLKNKTNKFVNQKIKKSQSQIKQLTYDSYNSYDSSNSLDSLDYENALYKDKLTIYKYYIPVVSLFSFFVGYQFSKLLSFYNYK